MKNFQVVSSTDFKEDRITLTSSDNGQLVLVVNGSRVIYYEMEDSGLVKKRYSELADK